MRALVTAIVAVSVIVVINAARVDATPLLTMSFSLQACASSGHCQTDTATNSGPFTSLESLGNLSGVDFNDYPAHVSALFTDTLGGTGSANASLAASMAFNSVSVSADTQASYGGATKPVGFSAGTSAAAQLSAISQDSFTATSSTLPLGTPVEYLATVSNTGSMFCSPLVSTGTFADEGGDGQYIVAFQAGSNIASLLFQCNYSAPFVGGTISLDGVQTMIISTTIGATVSIEGQTQAFISVGPGNGFSFDSTIDPPTTGFFIDPITAGASYTTASGTSYLTPTATDAVPEPATLTLLGIGLAGVTASRRLSLRTNRRSGNSRS